MHPDRRAQFEQQVQTALAHDVELFPSAALIARGCLGRGSPHPRLHERAGDYTPVPRGNAVSKDWLPGGRHCTRIGVQGGVRTAGMLVPPAS